MFLNQIFEFVILLYSLQGKGQSGISLEPVSKPLYAVILSEAKNLIFSTKDETLRFAQGDILRRF